MLTRVSSAMPTTDTSDEALSSRMNSLISGGTEMRSACGSSMRRQMSTRPKPSAIGRLALAARHRVERAAQDLRLIGARGERQAADRRRHRRHVEAELGEEIVDEQQLHQQRHAAKEADVEPAEPRQPRRRESRARQTTAPTEAERDAGERDGDRTPAACVI